MGSRPRPGPNDAGTSQGLGRPAHRGSHSRPVRLIPLKKALCRTDRGIASQKEATLRINARFSTSRCVYSCEGAFVFSSFHFSHSRVNLSLFRRRIQKKQSGITQNPICKCGSPDMLTTSILTDFVGGSRTSFHRMAYSAVSAQAVAENGVFTRLSTRDRNTMPDDRKTRLGKIQRKPFGIRIGRECSSEQKSRENCFSRGKRHKEQ